MTTIHKKNGNFFISVVDSHHLIPSVWDPYAYKDAEGPTLSKYVVIQRPSLKHSPNQNSPFKPIEYKDIPPREYLTFKLEPRSYMNSNRLPVVPEGVLLFGTMRAYLGNSLITPLAEWISIKSPVFFSIKSEFVAVLPEDKLTYFWLAFMRSNQFLENLPLGSGGTRPRLHLETLQNISVSVPPLDVRQMIDHELSQLAIEQWGSFAKTNALLTYYMSGKV